MAVLSLQTISENTFFFFFMHSRMMLLAGIQHLLPPFILLPALYSGHFFLHNSSFIKQHHTSGRDVEEPVNLYKTYGWRGFFCLMMHWFCAANAKTFKQVRSLASLVELSERSGLKITMWWLHIFFGITYEGNSIRMYWWNQLISV